MVAQIKPNQTGVQGVRTLSPGIALAKGVSERRGFDAVADFADRAMMEAKDYEQNKAAADMSLEFSEAYNQFTAKEVMTTQEAMDLGVKDSPHLWNEAPDGTITEREDVELWEVLPDLAKDKYDSLTEKYSTTLSGAGTRGQWVQDRVQSSQEMYNRMLADQREQYWERDVAKYDMAIERAHESGDHGLAISMAQNHMDPRKREEATLTSMRRTETDGFHQAIQNGDPEDMMAQAAILRDPYNESALTEQQQTSWVQQLESSAKQASATEATQRSFELEQSLAAIDSAIAVGDAGYADVLDYAQWLYDTGQEKLVPKTWLSTKRKEIDKFEAERLEQERLNNTVLETMAGLNMVDTTDKSQIKAINRVADTFAANGNQEQLYKLASTTRYIPDVLRLSMNASLNTATPVDNVVQSAAVYNKLRVQDASMIEQIPDKTQQFLSQVYALTRGGAGTEDAINSVRDQFNATEPDILARREETFRQYAYNGDMRTTFNDMVGGDEKFNNFWQRNIPFTENTAVSDAMYEDYFSWVRHAALAGATQEEAQEYAYGRVSGAYSVTEVNGVKEIMRDSPEAKYGLTTEQIQQDKARQLNEQFGIPEGEAGQYVLRPGIRTQFERQPSYMVLAQDDFGLLTPQRDQYGQHVMWKPDVAGIQKKTQEDARKQATIARKREQMFEENNIYRNVGEEDGGVEQDPVEWLGDQAGKEKHRLDRERAKAKSPYRNVGKRTVKSLEDQIRSDEGIRRRSYMDTEGHLTAGIGHKLTAAERKRYPEGAGVTDKQIKKWFKEDMAKATAGADRLIKKHGVTVTEEDREILINMVFQMGETGVNKFGKMWGGYKTQDRATIAREMKDSRWYKQTTNRANRLISRIEAQ